MSIALKHSATKQSVPFIIIKQVRCTCQEGSSFSENQQANQLVVKSQNQANKVKQKTTQTQSLLLVGKEGKLSNIPRRTNCFYIGADTEKQANHCAVLTVSHCVLCTFYRERKCKYKSLTHVVSYYPSRGVRRQSCLHPKDTLLVLLLIFVMKQFFRSCQAEIKQPIKNLAMTSINTT